MYISNCGKYLDDSIALKKETIILTITLKTYQKIIENELFEKEL